MNKERYVLKMFWQSKIGIQEVLYLGYNESGKMDCVSDKDKAKRMTKEDCEDWLLILVNGNRWSIEEVEVIKETPEVNNNDTSN